jgi:low affinity Fe/Cu permease
MVFIIQNTQNRGSKEIHLKLDELIRAIKPARDILVDLEDVSDAELDKYEQEFKHLHDKVRKVKEKRKTTS